MMKKIQILFSVLFFLTTCVYADTQNSRGELLYAQCSKCHGLDGKNKAFGKSGIIAGQPSGDLIQRLTHYKEGNGSSVIMIKQVKALNTQDIASLADYISKLKK